MIGHFHWDLRLDIGYLIQKRLIVKVDFNLIIYNFSRIFKFYLGSSIILRNASDNICFVNVSLSSLIPTPFRSAISVFRYCSEIRLSLFIIERKIIPAKSGIPIIGIPEVVASVIEFIPPTNLLFLFTFNIDYRAKQNIKVFPAQKSLFAATIYRQISLEFLVRLDLQEIRISRWNWLMGILLLCPKKPVLNALASCSC